MRVLSIVADMHGCFTYRCKIPHDALLRYGVETVYLHFTPLDIDRNQLETLVNAIKHFDLVIVQRCYLLPIMANLRAACDILGKPLIFETDDDYLSIIPSNPAYFAIAADQELFSQFHQIQFDAQRAYQNGNKKEADDLIKKANEEILPKLLESRARGERDYIEILKMVDAVTTSTQELANTIYPYNKRIGVFRNNVRQPNPFRLHAAEDNFIIKRADGALAVDTDKHNRFGIHTKPSYAVLKDHTGKALIKRTPRIGYTCTASHWGEDWNTVVDGINKVAAKFQDGKLGHRPWWIYFEEKNNPYNPAVFSSSQTADRTRILTIAPSGYDIYMANIGNIDIGICPLHPNAFNLSKSDIKAVEYASWGAAPLVPNIRTYTRSFIDGKTCLTYTNEKEFVEKLELLITNHNLREEIGRNALDYVCEERLAHLKCNTLPRYEFYKSLIEDSVPLKMFVL